MIRRPRTGPNGVEHWVLISQVDHARLSGEMAEHWGNNQFSRLDPFDELVAAIHHHDDGWANWELAPNVDAATGQPLDFTEMPLAESLAIWRRSIHVAARLGDLAPFVVSGHFTTLLDRAAAARPDADAEWTRLSQSFLREQQAAQTRWLATWLAAGPAQTEAQATSALACLQRFDALSLWLCCRERTEPLTIDPPLGPRVTFAPATAERIVVDPWPFQPPELTLKVSGRQIAVGKYPDRGALSAARSEPATLRWTLIPSTQS